MGFQIRQDDDYVLRARCRARGSQGSHHLDLFYRDTIAGSNTSNRENVAALKLRRAGIGEMKIDQFVIDLHSDNRGVVGEFYVIGDEILYRSLPVTMAFQIRGTLGVDFARVSKRSGEKATTRAS